MTIRTRLLSSENDVCDLYLLMRVKILYQKNSKKKPKFKPKFFEVSKLFFTFSPNKIIFKSQKPGHHSEPIGSNGVKSI